MRNSRGADDGGGVRTTGGTSVALGTAALCIVAAGLRLLHVGHGLPDFTEEAMLFRKAIELWGAVGDHADLNPHWFVYPSLGIYLQYVAQHIIYVAGGYHHGADFLLSLASDPTRGVVAGRCVGIVADVITIVFVGRIARRYGTAPAWLAMGIVAFSPTMIRTSRLIYTDSVMCALAVAAIDQLLSYREHGLKKHMVFAAVLIGLATGAKYPAALLAIPLAVAAWHWEARPRLVGVLGLAVGLVVAAFLCTTPFALVSWSEFMRDLTFIGDVAEGGGLGKMHGIGLGYYLKLLSENLGWVGCALLGLALVKTRRGVDRGTTAMLWLCWLVLFAPIASVPVEAERYLVSVTALSAILVAAGAALCIESVPKLGGGLPVVLLLGSLLQPIGSGAAAATAGSTSTHTEARRWCRAHLTQDDLVLTEAYGPNLLSALKRTQVMAGDVYAAAGSEARAAYDSQWSCHIVDLPLLVAGYASIRLPTPDQQELAVFPHAVDWNAAIYDVRLLKGVNYVITTGAVRGRFEADPGRFPAQRIFYTFLDRHAEQATHWTSGPGVEGAEITIYRLTAGTHAAALQAGPLDSLWWARFVPAGFKATADSLLRDGPASAVPDWGLPLWGMALRGAYWQRYGPFADELASELVALGRWTEAAEVARGTLTILPEDVDAAVAYARSQQALSQWSSMETGLARTINVLSKQGPVPVDLLLLQVDALVHIGRTTDAAHILTAIIQGGDEASAGQAREKLERLRAVTP